MKPTVVLGAVLAAGTFAASTVHAQTTDYSYSTPSSAEQRDFFRQRVAAPRQAFELTVGTGYTQGFGMLQPGVGMPNVATPGIGIDLGVGYRIDPRWSVSAEGQYQEFNAERAGGARGMTGGIAGTYHIAPYMRSDPFLKFGTGYRMLWESNLVSDNSTMLTHGFQLAKAAVGFDIRASEDVAVAPMIGADLNLFLWQDGTVGNNVPIRDPRLNTFVFAGAQGRFDIGGMREDTSGMRTTAKR